LEEETHFCPPVEIRTRSLDGFTIFDHISENIFNKFLKHNGKVSKNMNFGPKNGLKSDLHFTHPPSILHFNSLPGFVDKDQQKVLNQTLPNGGQ